MPVEAGLPKHYFPQKENSTPHGAIRRNGQSQVWGRKWAKRTHSVLYKIKKKVSETQGHTNRTQDDGLHPWQLARHHLDGHHNAKALMTFKSAHL